MTLKIIDSNGLFFEEAHYPQNTILIDCQNSAELMAAAKEGGAVSVFEILGARDLHGQPVQAWVEEAELQAALAKTGA
jgi:hypothetical protein